jgi:uncharacterized membrane protein
MRIEKKRYFFTGMLVVLPVLVTIYLFVSLFSFFDNILGRYISRLTIAQFGVRIPGLGLLIFLILIFVTGFFATNYLGRRLLLWIEKLWFRFPLIGKIYTAAKQMTRFLFSPHKSENFQKVVLLQYPRVGIYSLGFVTSMGNDEVRAKTGRDLVNVLVPTVPNPLTGFVMLVPKEDLIYLDMGIDEAIKIVISGGILDGKTTEKPSFISEE